MPNIFLPDTDVFRIRTGRDWSRKFEYRDIPSFKTFTELSIRSPKNRVAFMTAKQQKMKSIFVFKLQDPRKLDD